MFLLRRETSTASVNRAMAQKLPQRKWKIRRKPDVYVLGFYWLS